MKYSRFYVVAAAISCFIVCIGDFSVTFFIGYIYKGYDFLNQSESYLGISGSPVGVYMSIWGIIFSLLFTIYAFALGRTIFSTGKWQRAAVWLIFIYGIGEGVGSGLFPYNHIGNELTLSGKLHSLFSGIGVTALVLLPIVLWRVFPRHIFPRMNAYIRFVGWSGILLIVIFILSRLNIVPMRGLWQRLFILDYYSLMIVISINMLITQFRSRNAKE